MPRKRKTRAVGGQLVRPKATLPEGDEGQNLDAEDKEAKLSVMAKDFDDEIQARIKQLRNDGKNLLSKIRTAYSLELLQIPKHVREMKVSDYLKYNGNDTENKELEEEGDENLKQIYAKVQSAVTAYRNSPSPRKECQRRPLQTVNEEAESSTLKPAAKRGRQLRGKAAAMLPPPSTAAPGGRTIRKTRQRMFETPAGSSYPMGRPGFETPLVTPKFDPRLPMTPALGRQPKINERIMSMTGSPIYISGIHRGEMRGPLDILSALQGNTNISELKQTMDGQTMQSLQELHNKLSAFIKS